MENLKNELRLARRITHKNVCRIYDFSRADGFASISMEFVQGESLRNVLNRFGAFSTRTATKPAGQISAGLREAHAQCIVHRDIKPENFTIDAAGNVKVMDYGLAHLLKERSTGAVGTPSYMAPEQAQERFYDQRADIYALGLVLFEMFTGSAAFAGDTPIAVALKQIGEAPRNPRDVEQTIPEHIGRAILRCLEKDPQQRFSSVKELQAALIDDSITTQENFPVRPKFSSIYLVDVLKALGEKCQIVPTAFGLVVLAAVLVTAVITYRTTKNKQEPASFQNAQSMDSEEEWKTLLKNYREEGQLSLAAQERSPQQQTQTVAVNASRPAPLSETAPASAPTDASAPPAKQRPNWTALFDTVSIRSGVFMKGKEDGT